MVSVLNTLGVGSGIDMTAVINALVSAEKDPRAAAMTARSTKNDTRISRLAQVTAGLSGLISALLARLGDPAWDMFLDLTVARVQRRPVAVSSLCIAAAEPTTTVLRWIRNLCETGLFERSDDPLDARRVYITLAEPAAAMATYLASFAQARS